MSENKSDGSTASYYRLPDGATELQHLISHRNMNAQIGEIFRACYRYGMASHSDQLRDAKKVLFYATAEVERLEGLKGQEISAEDICRAFMVPQSLIEEPEESKPSTVYGKPASAEELQADDADNADLIKEIKILTKDVRAMRANARLPVWPTGGIVEQPTADDGWIEWKGGECPVDADLQVRVKLRGNRGEPEQAAGTFSWRHGVDGYSDIIAYRIAKDQS